MIDPQDGRIVPRAWMRRLGLSRIIAALQGTDSQVRFVGGCVRDAIADRPIKDVDLATPLPPEEVEKRLQEAGIKVVPTGRDHGTMTAVAFGEVVEVTTLRVDLETFGRHAKVGFTDDWEADAGRRDLTINALSADPDGYVYDPFGGLADLAAGRIRFVGSARQRIEEDYLRILRLFRFQAYYGRGPLDRETLEAVQATLGGLKFLSAERIATEFLRLLDAPDPSDALRAMEETGVLTTLLDGAAVPGVLHAFLEDECAALPADNIARFAALLAARREAAGRFGQVLRLSNALRARLELLCDLTQRLGGDLEEGELRRLLYRHGKDHLQSAHKLLAALCKAGEVDLDPARLAALSQRIDSWNNRHFPVAGRDLLALGLAPGPEIGRILTRLEDWWLMQDPAPGRARCLSHLESLLPQSPAQGQKPED